MKYSLPCPHETNPNLDPSEVHPDYHPLTKDELRTLLTHRYSNVHYSELSSIQVRICQAVPGAECPNTIEGENAHRTTRVDELYVHGPDRMGLDDLTDKIWDQLQ